MPRRLQWLVCKICSEKLIGSNRPSDVWVALCQYMTTLMRGIRMKPAQAQAAGVAWPPFLRTQEFGLVLANLLAWLLILILDPQHNFASLESARLLLREAVTLGIFSIGAAIVIIAGGIDLSLGSVIAFTGVVCAMLL